MSNLPGDPRLVSKQEEIQSLVSKGEITHQIPVEDFFRTPEKSNFKISPDGKYYAYLSPYQRRQNIHIVEVETAKDTRLTSYTDRNISNFVWVDNKHIVFLKDDGGNENFHVWLTPLTQDTAKDLTPYPEVRAEVLDILENDEDHIIIAMNKNHPSFFEPYKVNLHSGEYIQLAENDDEANPITSWQTDHDGNILLASRVIDGTNTALLYRANENDTFKEVVRTDFKTEVRPLFFDFHQKDTIIAISNDGRDKSALIKYDLNSGEEIEVLFDHDEVDVSAASFSKLRKKLTAASFTTDKRDRYFFDDIVKSDFEYLQDQLGDVEIGITSHSKDESKWLIRTYTDRSLGDYYLYDIPAKSILHIQKVSPWIDVNNCAHQRPISYTSRDGLTIHGYLTLPEKGEGPFPMIVNPHGGPWHRDTWGFNPEVQLFASRGYAVLQMNFRGSTGYGRSFWEKSFKQWGQTMQDDITDGVQWAVSEGHADPNRLAIYGGSYGGYATLAGVCYTPELYKCAIDYVGVSNLFTFMKTIPPYWEPYLAMMYEMVGHPEKDKEMMEAYSPALHADKIKVPLFIIQGANDPRVNIDESDQIVRSLRARNVDVPYMVKYDEGHGFHNEENRFEVYKAMLGFLADHL